MVSEFQFTENLLNNSGANPPYNLWEYFASLSPEGSTILVPSDLAWADPSVQLTLRMLGGMAQTESGYQSWFINLALYSCLSGFKSDKEWEVQTVQ